MTLTSAAPSASERTTGKSDVMPMRWARSAMGCRPVLIESATAAVFVKDGDEFVRVSTNVLTPEGKRGIGTLLARNAAYAAVIKGDTFCGPVDVLGTAFDACYHPVKDGSGKLIGVTYIGHKK